MRTRRKKPPAGFDELEAELAAIELQLRDAEAATGDGKRNAERMWPIFRLHHQRSRLVFNAFYKEKRISRAVFDYCVREQVADAALIAKWKKAGYEKLCCVRCADRAQHNYKAVCVCRVPRKDLDDAPAQCVNCGCRGCASSD